MKGIKGKGRRNVWKEIITLDGMFDFDYSLSRLSFDPLIKVNQQDRTVYVPVKLMEEDKHIVKIQALGTTERPKFALEGENEEQETLVHKIKEIFQWDKPLEAIQHHFQKTELAPLFRKYPGTPIVKDFGYYEALMKTIIHQQLNMKFAYTLSTRFVQKYGEEVDGVWFYPSPDVVADIPYEDLRELQFSQRKAEYIIDTSRAIVEGKLNLNELASKSDDEVIQSLVKIRGIGHWTAENWLLFGVGRNNLLPAADIGIQNALKKFLHLESKPHKDDIYKMGEAWSPYRSYASIVLWRSIEG